MIVKNKKLIKEFFNRYQPTLDRWYGDYSVYNMKSFIDMWEFDEDIIERFISTKVDFTKKKKYWNVNGFPEYYLTSMLFFLKQRDHYTFDRLKTAILNYLEISKTCRELNKEHPSADDQFMPDENGFDLLGEFSKKFSSEELNEIESLIENNIDEFIGYEFYNYRWEKQPDLMIFLVDIQKGFCFSQEFLKRNKKYFNVEVLINNPLIKNDLDYQYIVFGEILEDEMNRHLKFITRDGIDRTIKIDDEKRDEMILKFSLD